MGVGGGGERLSLGHELSIMDLIYWLVLNVGSLALLIAGTEFVVEQAIFFILADLSSVDVISVDVFFQPT